MPRIRRITAILSFAAVWTFAWTLSGGVAQAEPIGSQYKVTDLGTTSSEPSPGYQALYNVVRFKDGQIAAAYPPQDATQPFQPLPLRPLPDGGQQIQGPYDVTGDYQVGRAFFPNQGSAAYRLSSDGLLKLPHLGGGSVLPLGVNSRGDVVGHYYGSPTYQSFLYDSAKNQYVGLPLPNGPYHMAVDIDDQGRIAGIIADDHDGYHGYVIENGQAIDLNHLLEPNSGWIVTSAASINTDNSILALGVKRPSSGLPIKETDFYDNPELRPHVLLLTQTAAADPNNPPTPISVPEPQSLTIGLGLALGHWLFRRYRRHARTAPRPAE